VGTDYLSLERRNIGEVLVTRTAAFGRQKEGAHRRKNYKKIEGDQQVRT